jgi:FAD/FMN-containing dehydrogenase
MALTIREGGTVENGLATELQPLLHGPVIVEGDLLYDELRIGYNAMFDRRPAAIARCTGAADIQAALAFARERGLTVAVRSGGHSLPGASTIDGGLLLELGLMQGIRVDPRTRTANVQAGVKWGLFDRETQAYGLSTTGGVVSTTGVAGLTLGGGVGRLMREYGLTCDNVLSFDVVLADGSLVTASEDSEPDLYWALRGGGGNFGIVTNFEFQLHPVGPLVLGGMMVWPAEQAREVIAASGALLDDPPEQLSVQMLYTKAPDFPMLPESSWNTPIFAVAISWTGAKDEGEQLLKQFRSTGAPLLDAITTMPYAVLQGMSDALAPWGRRGYLKSGYLSELSDDALDRVEAVSAAQSSRFSLIELYLMGGAVARVPSDATAFAQRSPKLFWSAVGQWYDPAEDESETEWCRSLDTAMAPLCLPGRYINFVADLDEESIRSALGADTYARLTSIKAKYDPDNVFSHNPNAPQRGAAAAQA